MPKNPLDELYTSRVLVFIEDNEKGVFNQVYLDKEQFKAVTLVISRGESGDGISITVGEQDFDGDLFLGCDSIELE
jgi:hypothetical protein